MTREMFGGLKKNELRKREADERNKRLVKMDEVKMKMG